MTLDLDELERLHAESTPPPWGNAGYPLKGRDGPEVCGPGDILLLTMECRPSDDADATLIAALRNAAPALLAEAREAARLRERVAELEAKAGALIACIDRGEVGTTARHYATSALRAALTPEAR